MSRQSTHRGDRQRRGHSAIRLSARDAGPRETGFETRLRSPPLSTVPPSALTATCGQPRSENRDVEDSRNKQLRSREARAVLGSVMKHPAAPLRPAWDVNRHFAQRLHTGDTSAQQSLSYGRDRQGAAVLGFQSALFHVSMAPKRFHEAKLGKFSAQRGLYHPTSPRGGGMQSSKAFERDRMHVTLVSVLITVLV